MFEALYAFVSDLPVWLQWAGVLAIAAIPFVESYFGSALGVIGGVNPIFAVAAAIVGNAVSMIVVVSTASGVRSRAGGNAEPLSPRRQKLKRLFDKYGVAVVSLLGQTVLPSQITSAAMVGFGADRGRVIAWQIVSIILWGVAFGVLATTGVEVLELR